MKDTIFVLTILFITLHIIGCYGIKDEVKGCKYIIEIHKSLPEKYFILDFYNNSESDSMLFTINGYRFDSLDNLINYLKSEKIDVLLYYIPKIDYGKKEKLAIEKIIEYACENKIALYYTYATSEESNTYYKYIFHSKQ